MNSLDVNMQIRKDKADIITGVYSMSNSAWDETVKVKTAGLPEGTYEVELKDIVREDMVVLFKEGLRSIKEVSNKEYADLTSDQKAKVDSQVDEYWPARKEGDQPRIKASFVDQYRFVFVDPATGSEMRQGATFPIQNYNAAKQPITGAGKSLTDFITRATGIPVAAGDEFKLSDFFKHGDKYVLNIVKVKNFSQIDPASVMRKELAKPIVKGKEALSERAKTMLEYLKANMQGRPKRDIVDLYGTGQFGTYPETTAAWQEIMKNVKYTSDGKTLDFSEA